MVNATPQTTIIPTVPSTPQDPQGSSGEGYVLITWTAPSDDGGSDIISYNIYRGTNQTTLILLASVLATQTAYNDTSVENGQTYYYKVTAVNDEGESPQSTLVVDTPGGEDGGEAGDNTVLIILGAIIAIAVVAILVFVLRKK
jgi:hypothetical protein